MTLWGLFDLVAAQSDTGLWIEKSLAPSEAVVGQVIDVNLELRSNEEICGKASTLAVPLDIVLVIDKSGTMRDQPLEDAKNAAIAFIDTLTANDQVGMVVFDRTATTIHALSLQHETVKARIR